MPRLFQSLLIAFLLLAVAGGAYMLLKGDVVRRVYRGGGTLEVRGSAVLLRQVIWEPPALVPAGGGALGEESGDLILLALGGSGGDLGLAGRLRAPAGWLSGGAPAQSEAASLHWLAGAISPRFSPAGDVLFFASDRPGGLGGLDLWSSRRGPEGWEAPINLGPGVNSPYDETEPALADGGAVLVFSTDRPYGFLLSPPDGWAELKLEHWSRGSHNLAVSRARDTAEGGKRWSPARALEAAVSGANERDPCFSPAGDYLYFASDRPGGAGGFDLYRSRRLAWPGAPEELPLWIEAPENLGEPLNSSADERSPALFNGGFALLYRRGGEESEAELLESRSREVIAELEIASLPLRFLVENFGRISLLVLSAAALAALAVTLFRTRRSWAVNLLVRSAVTAVLIHLGLLYVFYFWQVGNRLLAMAEREEERRVSLESSLAARIASEVREQKVELPEPLPRAEERSTAPAELRPLIAAVPKPEAAAPGELASLSAEPPAPSPLLEVAFLARPEAASSAGLLPALERLPAPEAQAALLPQERPAEAEPEPEAAPRPESRSFLPADRAPATPSPATELAPAAGPLAGSAARSAVDLARTPVLSPERSDFLPPLARAKEEPAVPLARLPVPEQSPREAEEAAPKPEAGSAAPLEAAAAPLAVIRRDPLLGAPDLPPGRWDALPPVLPPPAASFEAEERYLAAPLLPETPSAMASARVTLPEPAPLAAKSSTAPETAAGPARPAVAGRRELAAASGREELRPTTVVSSLAAPAARPLDAAGERAPPVSASALARLEPQSAPGALEAPRPLESPELASRPRLPEAGARQPADVVAEAGAPAPAAPAASGQRSAAADVRADLAPPQVAAAPEPAAALPAASQSSLARLAPAVQAPAGSGLSAGAVERPVELPGADSRSGPEPPALPEAAPDLPRRLDLREARDEKTRKVHVERLGGSAESEAAVSLALEWLARHQSPDGRWDVDGFDAACGGCRSPGTHERCDVAITGLAVLSFLGQNHTPGGGGPHARTVAAALGWLLSQQAPNGSLAGEDTEFAAYSHSIGLVALGEAYQMTRDARFLEPLRRGAELLVRAQHPRTGGWRYQLSPPIHGDTSVSGWAVMALSSASAAVRIPDGVFHRARHWFDVEVGGGRQGGIYGYSRIDEPRVAMVAEGLFARQILGSKRGDGNVEEAARYIHTETRSGQHLDNLYLLYYGSMALYQHQGWIWESWNAQVRDFLVRRQHRKGPLAGSWDPVGPWSEAGGRVLSTAFAALTLEVYYRYLPMYWAPGEGVVENR
jgi:hypothetical protein